MVLVAIPLASPAAAGTPPGGEINLALDAAPDIAPVVSPRLVLDGVDVTDTYCGPGGEAYGAQIACSGLPDGEYTIEAAGVPDGLRTAVNCTDIVAAQAINPIIGGGFTNWICDVFVGAPAVVLTVNLTVGDDPPDDVRFTLAPVDGVDIECIDDTTLGTSSLRCRNLDTGNYELEISGVPGTFVALEPFCSAAFFTADVERGDGPVPSITEDLWLWRCDVNVAPRALIEVQTLSADRVLPAADELGLQAIGPDGDVTSQCPLTSGVPDFRRTFSCEIETGSYTVAFSGLPDATLDSSCESFDLPADQASQVSCYWGLVLEPSEPVNTVPPTTSPPTIVDELPVTGSSSTTVPIAFALLLGGSALVGLARRRNDA